MHCGDLDHRVASILPPFNVVHAQVVRKAATPEVLTDTQAEVFYAAASNPRSVVQIPAPLSSNDFWDLVTGNR
jgi:hypothetical protein